MKRNIKNLLIALAIPLGVGIVAGLLTRGGMDAYDRVIQPALAPPDWVFPVVWTILYTLMGVASYLVYISDSDRVPAALGVYGLQLLLNFIWPFLFFNLELYGFSAVWLIALLIFVIVTTVEFFRIHKTAGYLMIPYILWLLFAAYLNISVAILN